MLDPHGELVSQALESVHEWRQADLIHFNVPDSNLELGFNPLDQVAPQDRALATSDLIDVLKKIWAEFCGPRLEHVLRNALLALLYQPEPSLSDVLKLPNYHVYLKLMVDGVVSRPFNAVGWAIVITRDSKKPRSNSMSRS